LPPRGNIDEAAFKQGMQDVIKRVEKFHGRAERPATLAETEGLAKLGSGVVKPGASPDFTIGTFREASIGKAKKKKLKKMQRRRKK